MLTKVLLQISFFKELLDSEFPDWLEKKQMKKLALVISKMQKREVLERWQFDIMTDLDIQENGYCFIYLLCLFLRLAGKLSN